MNVYRSFLEQTSSALGNVITIRISVDFLALLVLTRAPCTRGKLDTMEPTLLLSSLVYLVLFPCSLQACLVFPLYIMVIEPKAKLSRRKTMYWG
jgi:hypothetical protein